MKWTLPVDLDDRIAAQDAALKRGESIVLAAEAQVREALAREVYAENQAKRYEQLLQVRSVSEEVVEAKRQERQVTEAGFAAARQELLRVRSEREGLIQQRDNLRLIAPVGGLVAARNADPGTTVVVGQSVVEVIDPTSLWINVRFDQLPSSGLRAGLPAHIMLRSQDGNGFAGRVLRVEPMADAVTEETLAKVISGKSCNGPTRLIRYADDFVVCFEKKADAERFRAELTVRLAQFGLEVEPSKTKVIAFGPKATHQARLQGRRKPDTFDFLGFTHYCSRSRDGKRFRMKRKTASTRLRTKLAAFKEWLKAYRARMTNRELWAIACKKLRGHYAYYGVSDNSAGEYVLCLRGTTTAV